MRILALEPYYGGSHQAFLDQWICRSQHQWQLLSLPPHHWKWRMRHAGIWFSARVRQLWNEGARWDAIFCSDMLDLAQFQGLVGPPIAALPCTVYFHENQLTYPTRVDDPRDLHFALTNFTTALAARQVWFNSEFHRHAFLSAVGPWLTGMPDYVPREELEAIQKKSVVQSPGIDVGTVRSCNKPYPLHIAWAARWEHDKDPQTFFNALRLLDEQGIDFRLTLCGQAFRDVPPEFAVARHELADRIEHWGPVPSRREYLEKLCHAHVIVSTALHEFFGLAVMEGISLGLYPLLPRRLSYPELLDTERFPHAEAFFYDGSAVELAQKLALLAHHPKKLDDTQLRNIVQQSAKRYAWSERASAMDVALAATGGTQP